MKLGFYGPEADAGPYLKKNEGPFANSVISKLLLKHSMARANLNKSEWLVTNTTAASTYISKRPRICINWNPTFINTWCCGCTCHFYSDWPWQYCVIAHNFSHKLGFKFTYLLYFDLIFMNFSLCFDFHEFLDFFKPTIAVLLFDLHEFLVFSYIAHTKTTLKSSS